MVQLKTGWTQALETNIQFANRRQDRNLDPAAMLRLALVTDDLVN